MPDSTSRLSANPSLEQLQKKAKELLRQYRAGDHAALERFRAAIPRDDEAAPSDAILATAQFVIAREHGFDTWAKLKHHIEGLHPNSIEQYDRLAQELSKAYLSGESMRVREVNWNYGTAFSCDFHEPIEMERALPTWFASEARTPELALDDTRKMVAHSYGFRSWEQFATNVSQPPGDPRSSPVYMSSTPPFYSIDWKDNELSVRGPRSIKEWDKIFGVMQEHSITKLSAGAISDEAMALLPRVELLTHVELEGSTLTDEGAQHLARMPQLRKLGMGGWTSPLTDRGLAPLKQLTELRNFQICWAQHITDAGLANLAYCEHLEEVNLLGTHGGDGAIQALAGKPDLRRFRNGRGVTDVGIPLLHQLPVFKTWHGGEVNLGLMRADAQPNFLLLDGPFTDAGLRQLKGLNGLFALTFFWHCPDFTSAGLEPLRHLPNLGFLGCQDQHCDDEAMRQIAAIPKLRSLMGQGAVAGDEGWEALSHSQTLEYIWGRECPNFASRGFRALAAMPSLRGIAVSCKNVDDAALSTLPSFPALRELMPMDVPDEGFRHIGRCENLEKLWCMYCRETTDAATEHIAGLRKLNHYYAGMTQITDRSLEILGRMESLEQLEFWQCAGITNAGVARLAGLPRLRELTLDGMANVTRDVVDLFSARVRVKYSA